MHKIYIVGIGPGAYEQMTIRAAEVLKICDVIVGYTVYVDLIREKFGEKVFLTTPMRQEIRRCELAFETAMEGKTVAMICSGDAGVYGMSGVMYEIGVRYPEVELEVIPGVTAATAGAAVLGAPLMHDFCLISLSDLLTPWEKIERRLRAAAQADFVICIYNPASKKRKEHLKRACEIVLEYQSPDTVCGVVSNIERTGEQRNVLSLEELRDAEVDMFTTVFIGNSQTMSLEEMMVTPRGYRYV